MIRFECDYAEGAHQRILERLMETNLEQTPGYSEDHYCATARWYIRELCEDEILALGRVNNGQVPEQHGLLREF